MMSSKGITTFLQYLRKPISCHQSIRTMSSANKGTPGQGAGRGGGGGGTIREAGGSFGKREAALEEQYMREQQKEALDGMKNKIKNETNQKSHDSTEMDPSKDAGKTSTTSHPSPSGEGAVRSSGGSFVKRKSALEDQYIKNQEKTKK